MRAERRDMRTRGERGEAEWSHHTTRATSTVSGSSDWSRVAETPAEKTTHARPMKQRPSVFDGPLRYHHRAHARCALLGAVQCARAHAVTPWCITIARDA